MRDILREHDPFFAESFGRLSHYHKDSFLVRFELPSVGKVPAPCRFAVDNIFKKLGFLGWFVFVFWGGEGVLQIESKQNNFEKKKVVPSVSLSISISTKKRMQVL